MKFHYISPYSQHLDIGGALNQAIKDLRYSPDDWIIHLDQDAMWLLPDSKIQVEHILINTEYDILGCMTNRIRSHEQLVGGTFIDNDKVRDHIILAQKCREIYGDRVKDCVGTVAAFMLCFRVSIWERVTGFVPEVLTFDTEFCREARLMCNAKIGIMEGVYIFHQYRMMSKKPLNDIKHLIKK